MTKNNSLISVIIPVYNTEQYLRQCLDSLRMQTYPYYEIIVVDDGSTDNSSVICDQYAQIDKRFKVLHQSNSGSVIARKTGIEQAKGDFFTFVDADDWLEPDFLQHLYDLHLEFKSEISVCAPFGQISRYMWYKKFCSNKEQALQILFTDKFFGGYVWNKLYSRHLWEKITWAPQSMFEDLYLNFQLFIKANKIAFSSEKKYHYRLIPLSISHGTFKRDKLFYFDITSYAMIFAQKHKMQSLYNYLCVRNLMAAVRNFIHYFRFKSQDDTLYLELKSIGKRTAQSVLFPLRIIPVKIIYLINECFWLLLSDLYQIIHK